MMKLFNKLIFLVFFFMFIFTSNVLAEECSYKEKENLSKLASYVKVGYDIVKDENGNEYVEISIYNITEDIYISGTYGENDTGSVIAYYENAENGVYKIKNYNNSEIVEFRFVVRSNNDICRGDLRNIVFVKPMKNKFSQMSECKYLSMSDYMYCQEWITQKFNYEDWEIEDKIKDYKKSLNKTTVADKNQDIKNEREEKESSFFENKIIIIGVLILSIIIDSLIILLLLERVRRYNI